MPEIPSGTPTKSPDEGELSKTIVLKLLTGDPLTADEQAQLDAVMERHRPAQN